MQLVVAAHLVARDWIVDDIVNRLAGGCEDVAQHALELDELALAFAPTRKV
jgi:hypothetical protein